MFDWFIASVQFKVCDCGGDNSLGDVERNTTVITGIQMIMSESGSDATPVIISL